MNFEPSLRPLTVSSLLLLIPTLGACDTASSPYCEDTATVVTSLEDPTPGGVKPGDILRLIEGETVLPLEYRAQGDQGAATVEVTPTGETTELSVDFERGGGEIRWVESEEVYPPGGQTLDIAVDCRPRLEIDGTLSFASADGAFAELFDVTVRAELDWDGDLDWASVHQDLDLGALAGSYDAQVIEPASPSDVSHTLRLRWALNEDYGAPGEVSGQIGGGVEVDGGDWVGFGEFVTATFGEWSVGP